MEQGHPKWLDKAFLATVLQGDESKETRVTVLKFTVKPAVAAGNNYNSHMYRVNVEYKFKKSPVHDSVSLIVKASFEKGFANEVSKRYFSTESKVYSVLLPKMFGKIALEFGPKSFYCPVQSKIILKDLIADGYIMCDKYKQLDFSHCKSVFVILAKFHATSVACHHDDHELIETIGDECLYKDGGIMEQMKPWLKAAVKHCAHIIMDSQPQAGQYILTRVDQIWESLTNICKPKKKGLNALNHGDVWVNNMMFKHSDCGEVVDVKLIDFQIPRYASPVLDLILFIWTSGNEDVRNNRQEELYNVYLQTLNKTLEDLCCEERMTPVELQEVLKASTDWILITICYELALMICEPENSIDMENLSSEDIKTIETDERFLKMYYGKSFRALLPNFMRQFHACVSSYAGKCL